MVTLLSVVVPEAHDYLFNAVSAMALAGVLNMLVYIYQRKKGKRDTDSGYKMCAYDSKATPVIPSTRPVGRDLFATTRVEESVAVDTDAKETAVEAPL